MEERIFERFVVLQDDGKEREMEVFNDAGTLLFRKPPRAEKER